MYPPIKCMFELNDYQPSVRTKSPPPSPVPNHPANAASSKMQDYKSQVEMIMQLHSPDTQRDIIVESSYSPTVAR